MGFRDLMTSQKFSNMIRSRRKEVQNPSRVPVPRFHEVDIKVDTERQRKGQGHPSRSHEWGSDVDEKPQPNVYQHPDKIANPARRFRHSYDIYSIGLVLSKTRLWQNLQTFDNGEWLDAYAFRRFVLKKLVPELWGQCGSIYGGVVKECLEMLSDVGLEDGEGRRLAWCIAERLSLCNA